MRALYIVFLYFLFDRELSVILYSDFLNSIYTFLSKFFSASIILYTIFIRKDRKSYILLGYLFLVFFSMLLSTFIKEGDIRRVFMIMYPVFAMSCLWLWQCSNIKRMFLFIRYLSNLYLLLAIVNLTFIILYPSFFNNYLINSGDMYFLGGENQVGYPLLKGFCLVLLNHYFTNNSKQLYLYIITYITTILIIFSGSNIIGMVCMFILIVPNIIQRTITSIPLSRLLTIFSFLFVFVILLNNLSIVLESSFISYIVVDLLGKNLTLTNRTIIWDIAIQGFLNSPIIGNGIRETVNLFYIKEAHTQGYLSAHNQILQTLYECGILFFVLLTPLLISFSRKLEQNNFIIKNIFKATICTLLIMFMGEAIGIDKLLFILVIGYVIVNRLSYAHMRV